MLFLTHLFFSILIGLIVKDYFGGGVLFFIVLLFFSAFVDIDEKNSYISKRLRLVSWFATLFGHRGLFHTIYAALFFFILFYYFGLIDLAYAALIGYTSHLTLDSLTKQGIMWLYPVSKIKIRGFIKVGSLGEMIIRYLSILLILLLII